MKAHSRDQLTIVERKNSAHSRKRSKTSHQIGLDDLTSMFMPLYQQTWKGVGHNNVFWHTMKKMTDATAPLGGDCVMLSCLPGKQVYAEFNALPLMNLYDMPGKHSATGTYQGGYRQYCRSLAELCDRAMSYGNFYPMNYNNSGHGVLDAVDATGKQFHQLFQNTSWSTALTSAQNIFSNAKLLDCEFIYEGGYQSHKFTNTTSLPVYLEIREFMPREPLSPGYIYGDFDTTGPVVQGGAHKHPGLYETLAVDLQRQQQRSSQLSDLDYPDQGHLYEDFDDKAFKYNKYMKITNSKWVVGPAIHHRVDPGNTFNYTMNLPAFKLKFSELWQYHNLYQLTGALPIFFQGNQVTGGVQSPINYAPKFSKFVSIRATGSQAFTQGAAGSSTGVITQKDGMADLIGVDVLDPLAAAADNPTINPHALLNLRSATHGVQLLHTMEENHKCRLMPLFQAYHKDALNFLPNASGKASITIEDDMGFLDPTDNAVETVEGDME